MPACLMKIAAVATAEGSASKDWVNQEMPPGFRVPPLENTGSSHSMAQNFFRAFTLARIANVTGRADLRENTAELLNWQMARPTVWTTNYASWSHWIAQVGVLTLQELVKPTVETAWATPTTSAPATTSATSTTTSTAPTPSTTTVAPPPAPTTTTAPAPTTTTPPPTTTTEPEPDNDPDPGWWGGWWGWW